ncbi:hypothetical protein Y900_022465 [Mycolicibacterium aromaticivorans JS19b1 = JCM 16368]|uniref:Uncharacterized protein n=1 Tax=Mycolicibacterium aromaticivorans JS19b1 = JCM 16368 TaxID=1440774 RepID=A0A064CLZ8_9MYCO|nr:hypothetical protein [Mycolicibacterium aromaticivorans]KDF01620.1 hypothetical protein Y900_022465 [Mycolicibacterium aromaticivorans JS19b1 = JCM 16368]
MASGLSVLAESAGRYVHWGVIQISVTNLTIIAVMMLVFILALVIPFPSHGESADDERGPQ